MAPSQPSGQLLTVDERSTEAQLLQAGQALEHCAAVVVLAGVVRIWPEPDRLVMEVVDPDPSAHRCATEFEVLVENARRALESSRLYSHLPKRPAVWTILDDATS